MHFNLTSQGPTPAVTEPTTQGSSDDGPSKENIASTSTDTHEGQQQQQQV
jgi:hypothetical protein